MELSPMMKQYMEIKSHYKEAILFFRLGDFFEMFFDDALIASKILSLTLTARDCGLEDKAPMCGIPFHSADAYIPKLLEAGYNVAICEQTSLPVDKKKIVDRAVIRLITPGTVIEDGNLDSSRNNYICSVCSKDGNFGIAWCDLSTGEMYSTQSVKKNDVVFLGDILSVISPSEIICDKTIPLFDIAGVKNQTMPPLRVYSDWAFLYDNSLSKIKNLFKVNNLNAFGVDGKKLAISAAGALLEYFEYTLKQKIQHINAIKYIDDKNYLYIDSNSQKNLELIYSLKENKRYASLFWALNRTKTAMGSRVLSKWIEFPLNNEEEINDRLDSVQELVVNHLKREVLQSLIDNCRDIQRICSKIAYSTINPKECLAIRDFLANLPKIKNVLSTCNAKLLKQYDGEINSLDGLYKTLCEAIIDEPSVLVRDGGYIKTGYSKEIDEYRHISKCSKQVLAEMEARERERTGIKTLKINYNRIFGYFIEVTKSYLNLVPLNYTRRQTVANAERFITPELGEIESKILHSSEMILKLEIDSYEHLKSVLRENIDFLISSSESIAKLDVILSFSEVSSVLNYVKPVINSHVGAIRIVGGRHPVIEQMLKGKEFISNDTIIDNDNNRTIVLTGPNMAGKSTFMRQIALITIMAHIGCFVPCNEAEISICDRIFTRVGASDNLVAEQSTFMVEMIEVANILRNATSKSLVIFDEVGRGTSTLDGLSIAWAVIEYVNDKIKCKTLFATHYHELTELESILNGVKNYKIAVRETKDGILFLRKIVRGSASKSFGVEVASLAGVPNTVIVSAKKILKRLESSDIVTANTQLALDFNEINCENDVAFNPITQNDIVADEIKSINLNITTPIDALNLLIRLKAMLK